MNSEVAGCEAPMFRKMTMATKLGPEANEGSHDWLREAADVRPTDRVGGPAGGWQCAKPFAGPASIIHRPGACGSGSLKRTPDTIFKPGEKKSQKD
jgi:hypothetical protein